MHCKWVSSAPAPAAETAARRTLRESGPLRPTAVHRTLQQQAAPRAAAAAAARPRAPRPTRALRAPNRRRRVRASARLRLGQSKTRLRLDWLENVSKQNVLSDIPKCIESKTPSLLSDAARHRALGVVGPIRPSAVDGANRVLYGKLSLD